jgi:Zn-finger nucleic acid-binding protein
MDMYILVCPKCGKELVKETLDGFEFKVCPAGHMRLRLSGDRGMW